MLSPMRSLLIVTLLFLTACAGNPDGYSNSNEFDTIEAAKTRISLGLTYLKNGNYKQAKANLDQALDYAPRLADAHYSIAYYYQVVGENAQADKSYKQALAYAPANADIANSYGAFLCQQGQYENARTYFLKAVNTNRYSATAETYENLALCSQSQGEVTDAITYFQTALNHQPSRTKSMLLLSQLLASESRWEESRQILRRYEKLARVTPETLWLSIKIEEALGNVETARGYGDMLIRMYPSHPNSKDYLAKMNEKPQLQVTPREPVAPETAVPAQPQVEPVKTVAKAKVEERKPVTEVAEEVVPASEEPVEESAQAQTEERPIYHVVQKDENLYRISLQYNVRMQRIIDWNQLDDASSIRAGQKLFIVDPQSIE